MLSNYLSFVSVLIINWTFLFMYRCICGRTFYIIVYVKSVKIYDLRLCQTVNFLLCLEVSGLIILLFTPKFLWRYKLVLRACLYWENNWISSSTRRGVYWKRFILVFHSQCNRIIIIISAYQAECVYWTHKCSFFKQIFKMFRYSEIWLGSSLSPSWLLQTTKWSRNVDKRLSHDETFYCK